MNERSDNPDEGEFAVAQLTHHIHSPWLTVSSHRSQPSHRHHSPIHHHKRASPWAKPPLFTPTHHRAEIAVVITILATHLPIHQIVRALSMNQAPQSTARWHTAALPPPTCPPILPLVPLIQMYPMSGLLVLTTHEMDRLFPWMQTINFQLLQTSLPRSHVVLQTNILYHYHLKSRHRLRCVC